MSRGHRDPGYHAVVVVVLTLALTARLAPAQAPGGAKGSRPAALERACAIPERLDVGQRVAAPAEEVFALWRQAHLSAHAIEELKTELALEVPDLPGQRGLSDVQTGRRP